LYIYPDGDDDDDHKIDRNILVTNNMYETFYTCVLVGSVTSSKLFFHLPLFIYFVAKHKQSPYSVSYCGSAVDLVVLQQ